MIDNFTAQILEEYPDIPTYKLYPSASGFVIPSGLIPNNSNPVIAKKNRLAIKAAIDSVSGSRRIVLIPTEDTYYIDNRLDCPFARTTIAGVSQNTVLRLIDNAEGYTSASSQKPLIKYVSNNPINTGTGEGTQAFFNYLIDITISTGSGNPGAAAVWFISQNNGGMKNVTIQSEDLQGLFGIDGSRNPQGPALFENVTIRGFNIGMKLAGYDGGNTLRDCEFYDQAQVGLDIANGNTVFGRNLSFYGDAPPIKCASNTVLFLSDSYFHGLNSAIPAVDCSAGGYAVLQNCITNGGYSALLRNRSSQLVGGTGSDFIATHSFSSKWTPVSGSAKPLGLKVFGYHEHKTPLHRWKSVGASPGTGDCLAQVNAAIAAAIAEGKDTIYFHPGNYYQSGPIVVPSGIRRIIGNGCNIYPQNTSNFNNSSAPNPQFRVESGTNSLTIEGFQGIENTLAGYYFILHKSNRDLIVKNSTNYKWIKTETPASGKPGTLFIEDFCGGLYAEAEGQYIFAQQLNNENFFNPKMTFKNGVIAVIKGTKNEKGTAILVENSTVEFYLGSILVTSSSPPVVNSKNDGDTPMFEIINSKVSICATTSGNEYFHVQVEETYNGETRYFYHSNRIARGSAGLTCYSSALA